MRKIISFLTLLGVVGGLYIPFGQAYAQKVGQYFIVSAYYSPLPNQSFYVRGSYEADVYLNGRGTHGASGHAVKPGMLAAPKTFAFGTKIDLNGIGVGTVLDRGGAIVPAGERGFDHNRIDLYMGAGEVGLCRALNFGVRTVYGTAYTDEDANSVEEYINLEKFNSNCDRIASRFAVATQAGIFDEPVNSKTSAEDIKEVKKILDEVGYLKGPVDGQYDGNLVDSIYDFQLSYGIVGNLSETGAGYFGPKTRRTLKDAYYNGKGSGSAPASYSSAPTVEKTIYEKKVTASSPSSDIKELQEILGRMGYFEFEPNGEYTQALSDAIYRFQVATDILDSWDDVGSGYYGPTTRKTLKAEYEKYEDKLQELDVFQKKLEDFEQKRQQLIDDKRAEVTEMINAIPTAKLGTIHPEIRTLQKLLKYLGYMSVKDTAIFGEVTFNALAEYQVDLEVIDSINSQYAGVLGSITRQAIIDDLVQRFETDSKTYVSEIVRIEKEVAELQRQIR